MEKLLTQDEIDQLFRTARGSGGVDAGEVASSSRPQRWNLRDAGVLRKEQLNSISQIHAEFSRELAISIGGYLRDRFEVALVGVEQLPYRDFLARVSGATYYASFRLLPGEARGVLQLDLTLAFPMVDVLLGGTGGQSHNVRELSEIEAMLLEDVGQLICRELDRVWHPFGMQVSFEQRQPVAQMLRLMPAQEKTLSLSFEATMTGSKGMLNIAFPALVSGALLRKLATELVYQQPAGMPTRQQTILQRLLQSTIDMQLGTSPIAVKATDLLAMKAGYVLPLRLHIEEPARLRLAGRSCWLARPVRSSSCRRAAQLLERIAQPEEEV